MFVFYRKDLNPRSVFLETDLIYHSVHHITNTNFKSYSFHHRTDSESQSVHHNKFRITSVHHNKFRILICLPQKKFLICSPQQIQNPICLSPTNSESQSVYHKEKIHNSHLFKTQQIQKPNLFAIE